MSAEPVISVRNVSKAYRIWTTPGQRLLNPLYHLAADLLSGAPGRLMRRTAARSYRDFYALRDVALEVHQGEAVGIIGRNGSGKSTLLQVIAGTLQPTTGEMKVRGRVAALLELGSGFNPAFTGRENVQLSARVLGLTPREIAERFDAIAAYADIGDFLDEPISTYSSGMTVRLAFAVCAHVDADVLIIDEALGVGDARFQLKCARTIDQFVAAGRTLLFVSHDLNAVRRLCSRACLLDGGRILYTGRPNTVVNLYTKLLNTATGTVDISGDIRRLQEEGDSAPPVPSPATAPVNGRTEVPADAAQLQQLEARLAALQGQLEQIARTVRPDPQADALLAAERAGLRPASEEYAYGGELGAITRCAMTGVDGAEKTVFTSGEPVEVRLEVQAREPVFAPIYALTLKTVQGQEVYGTNTLYAGQPAPAIGAGERAAVVFHFPLNLVAGEYFLSVGWTQWVGEELVVIHRRYDTVKFTVLGIDRTFGIAHLFARIEVRPAGPATPP